jgi:DNA-binding transcriptional LysR family regulator
MPGNAPAREVSRQREQDAWTLRQEGRTEAAIAERLGVSQPAVSKMLRRVEDRVLKDLTKEVGRTKARQTAQLEWAASQAARAWERSLEDAVSVKESVAPIGPKDAQSEREVGVETERTTRGQSGNPALLAQFREALADIRKIWGLDAPTKVAATDDKGESHSILEALRLGLAIAYPPRDAGPDARPHEGRRLTGCDPPA